MNFNKIPNMTRVVVENAYGRLKGRFRSIATRVDLNVETVCLFIAACCVLHNFCEVMGEDLNEEWLQDVQLHLSVFPVDPNQGQNRNAVAIREANYCVNRIPCRHSFGSSCNLSWPAQLEIVSQKECLLKRLKSKTKQQLYWLTWSTVQTCFKFCL